MVDQLTNKDKVVGWRKELWLFIKAQLSAQVASFIDFFSTVFLVKLFFVYYLYATFFGSVIGGIVNCAINYGWVFHVGTHTFVKLLSIFDFIHINEIYNNDTTHISQS